MSDSTDSSTKVYTGRTPILSTYTHVDRSNIIQVINEALLVHAKNVGEIIYLENYKKGIQPILNRVKPVRPDINNKIVENRADEIVAFKVGYEYGEPIAYVSRESGDDTFVSEMKAFNAYMDLENKYSKDALLANMFKTFGTAYRLVLPAKKGEEIGDVSPFQIFNIDPRFAFVVYTTDIGNAPILGVVYSRVKDSVTGKEVDRCACYTDSEYFLVQDGSIVSEISHYYGKIPLIEYQCNADRQGEFEKVLGLLDAINMVDSDCVNGVAQFIQAIMVFKNVDISDATFQMLKDEGAIKIADNGTAEANVDYLSKELNQTQTTALKDIMWDAVREIVGMPDRHNGASTSDTGAAVIARDGWSDAESRAKQNDLFFKTSEKQLIRLALRYSYILSPDIHTIKVKDIDIKFTRRNYENTYQKAQTFDLLSKNEKLAPRLAFVCCGLFPDPETSYLESKKYADEQEKKQLELAKQNPPVNNSGSGGGQTNVQG